MTVFIDERLDERIENEFIALNGAETDEQRAMVLERLETLLNLKKDREKIKIDLDKRGEDNFWKTIDKSLEGAKIVIPVAFAAVVFRKVMIFEENGSILSTVGKALIPSLFRIKF